MPVEVTQQIADDIERLREIRAMVSALKKDEDTLRTRLLQLLELTDDGLAVDGDGRTVLIASSYAKTTVDRKRLEALYPDVFNECSGETTVTTLRVI